MALVPSSAKVCFNSNCNGGSEVSRKGWRRRTGECADLCDRCGSAFADGKFCETFHLNASGWRSCESCGKQIHCGCIVSFHMFVLLDAGGIECLKCTKKSFILTPNPAWPPPSLLLPALPETSMDIPVRSWSPIAGTGPVPWRQAPSVYNPATSQSNLQPTLPFEVSISVGSDRSLGNEQLPTFITDRKKKEDSSDTSINGSVKIISLGMFGEGATGNKCDGIPKPLVNAYQQSSEDDSAIVSDIPVTSGLRNGVTDPKEVSGSHVQRPTHPLSIGKQFCSHNLMEPSPNKVPVTRVQGPMCSPSMGNQFCSNNLVESSLETQTRNGRPRKEIYVRNQLLPRNRPRITDQELKQISGDANAKITPLFEKVLSASDAGRIGRLVLPKKCAEAYLPPISQPEGLPLVVQDVNGNDWILQFRFWPNNNSRMYVLEGITPCIQSMELQAGDTVTFSRLEPEGKLVMGYRKASTSSPAERGDEAAGISKVVSPHGDLSVRIVPGEAVPSSRHSKGSMASTMFLPINQGNMVDPASAWSDVDKSGYIAKEVIGAEVALRSKRKKNSNMTVGSKRLRYNNDDAIQLNVTFGEVQRLLRPHPNVVPAVMIIEGVEIQEHQDAPIIGRPTLFEKDNDGKDIQWVQCEDCFKWRKVPVDALLPSRWTCTKNSWDPERSLCSADEEPTPDQLEKSLPLSVHAASKKRNCAKLEPGQLDKLDGLDALAQLAMQEEGDGEDPQSSSQITTRHPRHRPGCSCIVCIQPPSGKAHKHKTTCTCNVCLTVKRRFQTLMLRREQKQSEKESVNARQKPNPSELPEPPDDDNFYTVIGNGTPNRKTDSNDDSDDDRTNKVKTSTSPFKSPIIDLNIQPEREDELPPTDSNGMMRLLQDTTDRFIRQRSCSNGILLGSGKHNADTTGG